MYDYQLPNRNVPTKGHFIKVTGEAELAVQPDMAQINLGVITENKELVAAQHYNSEAGTKVINSLLSLGTPKNNVQTFDYRIESDYDYENGKQIFRGYKVTHLLQVKIENIGMIGKIVDTAVKNGANYVSNVRFLPKNKDAIYQQALIMAVNNATEKAKTIAKTINVTLIPTPVHVVEEGASVQPLYVHQGPMVKGISSTQFEPGQISVKAAIFAEYQFY